MFGSFVVALSLTACASTQNIPYFQDIAQQKQVVLESQDPQMITLQPGDKISVIVNCRDSELSQLFNLPYTTRRLGQVTNTSSIDQGVSGYTIGEDGCIDFPVLGKVSVEGKTRSEVANTIKEALAAQQQASDAVVTVEFMNLRLYILGEVKTPGKYTIDQDAVTIIDAISMAGDLTIYGKRDNVSVKRIVDGKEEVYKLNLTNTADLIASPAYYLKQNDVVYVEPNKVRQRQSTVNGNNILSTSFWISVMNLAVTVAVLFVKKH